MRYRYCWLAGFRVGPAGQGEKRSHKPLGTLDTVIKELSLVLLRIGKLFVVSQRSEVYCV